MPKKDWSFSLAENIREKSPLIVHVRSSGGLFGADRVVLDLCENLPLQGYRCLLVPLMEADGSGTSFMVEARTRGIPVMPLRLRHPVDLAALYGLRRIALDAGAAILHGHDYKSNIALLMARGPWKRVTTLHGAVGAHRMQRLKEYLDVFSVNRFDGVICVSDRQKEAESKRGVRKITVVRNGIDPRPFQKEPENLPSLRESFELVPGELVIGTIGRLSQEKGYDVLLNASAQLFEKGRVFKVLIIGEGPMRQSLVDLSRKLHMGDNLLLPGFRRDVASLYRLLDVFCLPSLREGLPLALLEAMAAGRAVIASAVGGVPEVLGDRGDFGLCVPPGDKEALASALECLLDHPEQRHAMGGAAGKKIAIDFSSESMTHGVAGVYHGLL